MNKAAAPAIQIERPVIATEDGCSFDGYLARPENGRGPGIVIFSEMWGVAPSKIEMAEDYAKRGWCLRPQHVLALGIHRCRAVRGGRPSLAAPQRLRLAARGG
jgi:Dienelactone hydrolase family